MLKKLLRDNNVINPVLRKMIQATCMRVKPLQKLTSFYRIYGTVVICVEKTQFKIFSKSDDHIANELYYRLGYEYGEFKLLINLLASSNYFIDVGANTGIFSIFASARYSELQVISVEPHPSNFQRLLKNISVNKLKNIRPIPNALGSVRKALDFTVPSDMSISTTASANAGFVKNFYNIPYVTITVNQITFDELLSDVPLTSKDVIKIDVEYYELEVLKGAKATLSNKRPMVIIEILNYENLIQQYPEMEEKIDKHHGTFVFDFLTNLGYYGYSIGSESLELVDNTTNHVGRNYLFIPYKLSDKSIPFDSLSSLTI